MINYIKEEDIKYIMITIKISILYLEMVKSYILYLKNKQLNILNKRKRR